MYLHAAILFHLTIQTVSTLGILQPELDPRAYFKPRGSPVEPVVEPVRPEVIEHPVLPDPVVVPQHVDGQPGGGADDRPLDETVPGLSNLLPGQESQAHVDDPAHELDSILNEWNSWGLSFDIFPGLFWGVQADSVRERQIPDLQPPDPIRADYQHLPIDTSNKRKAPSSEVTFSDQNNAKKVKRTQVKSDFYQRMSQKLEKLEEMAKQGQQFDAANLAAFKNLEAENKALKEKVALLESQAIVSWTSPVPDENTRLLVSNGDQQAWELTQYNLPVGQPSGGSTFGQPAAAPDMSAEDLALFSSDLPIFGEFLNLPQIEGPHQKQRRTQGQLRSGSNAQFTEERHENRMSRRSPSSQPNIRDPATEYQLYINAYTEIRVNVSRLLVPYLTPVLEKANNSLIYDMVRSIHSDIVAYGPWTLGPYSNGHHCFDWIEDQMFGNITDDDISKNDTIMGVLADHAILIDTYEDIWGNATQIANATGYLAQMHTLRGYLNPKNSSIIPASWKSVQPLLDSLSFDVLYNKTLHK